MHSHLVIEVNKAEMRIPENQSLDAAFSSPLFNETEAYTHPFQLHVDGNRNVATIIDDVNASVRLVDLENLPARIIADGIPMFSGRVVTEDQSLVDSTFSFSVDSRRGSFKDMIADLKCSDIPLIEDIKIGEMIGEVKVDASIKVTREMSYRDGGHGGSGEWHHETEEKTYNLSGEFTPQALGFSYPARCVVDSNQYAIKKEERDYANGKIVVVPEVAESYINVTDAYPVKKYCNARVCYKHYAKEGGDANADAEGETSSELVDPKTSKGMYEDIWPYWVLDANRPQSGICFYVLYFLDCLFKHLGIAWDNSELLKIEDLKHLAFFTTQCRYRTERLHGTENNPFFHDSYTPPIHEGSKTSKDDDSAEKEDHLPNINKWLSSRGCGGKLNVNMEYTLTSGSFGGSGSSGTNNIETNTKMKAQEHYDVSANILAMYATKENFPKESVTTLIESLEAAFGIRFIYDPETNKCKAVLLREVLRNMGTPMKMLGQILSCHPVNEKVKGVHVCYSEESDAREQQEYLSEKKRDYDTRFDYRDFSEGRVRYGDGVSYRNIFNNVSPSDESCYVDRLTGNAYRIKVDKDANTFGELKPVIFQVAHLHGIELGDCSEENKKNDMVHEISIGFQPVDMTDINYAKERNTPTPYAINAVFVDEDMEHEFLTHKICNTFSIQPQGFGFGHISIECSLVEVLNTIESYDPTQTEDGNSPLQHIDWGLAVVLMRGGGSDATIQNYDEDYDGFGNSRWGTVSGTYQTDIDSMDIFGNEYDYNGTDEGLGGGERFSLKIRAYRNFRYYFDSGGELHISENPAEWSDPKWLIPCNADIYTDNVLTKKVRSRGLHDTFLAEYTRFLLNRHRLRYEVLMTVAELIAVKSNFLSWWDFDGKLGLIDNAKCSINAATGMGKVTVDLLVP